MVHHRFVSTVCSVSALAFCFAQPTLAQNLYVTSDRTIVGGNPVNDAYNLITIGFDGVSTFFPGIQADITGGSATSYINATAQSIVNISGGTFGTAPTGGSYASALAVQGGSTVNLSGGTFNSFGYVGSFSSSAPVSTFNMSGGSLPDLDLYSNSIFNMTEGTIAAIPGNTLTRGALTNNNNGTVNLSGGTVGTVALSGVSGIVGTTNISGGIIGSIRVEGNGILNFAGSELMVTAGDQYARFSTANGFIGYVRDYTVSGTLSSGTALNQTFTAGAEYMASDTLLNFRGTEAILAEDRFIQTDQTVDAVYNYVAVGFDDTFSTPSDPAVTVASGANVGFLDVYNDSNVQMTGGTVHAYISAGGTSDLLITGGTIGEADVSDYGIFAYEDATVSVLGGTVNVLQGYDNAVVTIGGSAQVATIAVESNFTVIGGSIQTAFIGMGTLNLIGGSVGRIQGFGGFDTFAGAANIHGGLASEAVLANVGPSLGYLGVDFALFGTDLSAGNPTDGTYSLGFGGDDLVGVWWDLSGTLADGSPLSARYFDADGATTAPARLTLNAPVTVPEPGTITLFGFLLPLVGTAKLLRLKRLASGRRCGQSLPALFSFSLRM